MLQKLFHNFLVTWIWRFGKEHLPGRIKVTHKTNKKLIKIFSLVLFGLAASRSKYLNDSFFSNVILYYTCLNFLFLKVAIYFKLINPNLGQG